MVIMVTSNLSSILLITVVSFLNLLTVDAGEKKEKPIQLFNGTDLTGWHKVGGNGQYKVVDGAIHGFGENIKKNTFLCTKAEYSDFILELEARIDMDQTTNSGIQFRSHVFRENSVRGYQYEFENAEKNNTGGVYDEHGTRGFISPFIPCSWIQKKNYKQLMEKHGEAVRAFQLKNGELFKKRDWNKIVIRCEGGKVQTWLNGKKQADFTDPEGVGYSKGIIGLQLHSGKECRVSWRNIVLTPLK